MITLVVLVSGGGSNLQSIIDRTEDGGLAARIAAVISNQADAYALERARKHGIAARVLDHTEYASRRDYDRALADLVAEHAPDLIILAGFMRILGEEFVNRFAGRIMNIHPSLLPDYKGLDTHRRVIENGETRHGATVHFVTAGLDDGPIIIQREVAVHANDTPESLQQRVLEQEHQIYPAAIHAFARGRISYDRPSIDPA